MHARDRDPRIAGDQRSSRLIWNMALKIRHPSVGCCMSRQAGSDHARPCNRGSRLAAPWGACVRPWRSGGPETLQDLGVVSAFELAGPAEVPARGDDCASLWIDVPQHDDITDRQDQGTCDSVAEHDDSALPQSINPRNSSRTGSSSRYSIRSTRWKPSSSPRCCSLVHLSLIP